MEHPQDTAKFREALNILQSMLDHRQSHPVERSDELYYELLIKYINRVVVAREEGTPLIAHSDVIPAEIFYAMDITPLNMEPISTIVALLIKQEQKCLATAHIYGLAQEICCNQRAIAGCVLEGWLPRPHAVIGSWSGCDNGPKTWNWCQEIYGIPGIYVDRPQVYSENALRYYRSELERLIAFLEGLFHKKMDYGRLYETLANSQRVFQIHHEVARLRKVQPAPMRSRRAINMVTMERFYYGTKEAIEFYQCVHDETKARVASHQGIVPQERYRLITLFRPPHYAHKIWDWLEREHGAVSVIEPMHQHRGEMTIDENDLIGSLARKTFSVPSLSYWCGPAEDAIRYAVDDAIAYGANTALYFAHRGCRQACSLIPMMKEELMKKAGIPVAVIDCDLLDSSMAPLEELQEKLETFLSVMKVGA